MTAEPTLEEVLQYFADHSQARLLKDRETAAKKFFYHFDSIGWVNAQGRKIEKWRSAASLWILKEFAFEEKEKRTADKYAQRRGVEPSSKDRKNFKATFD